MSPIENTQALHLPNGLRTSSFQARCFFPSAGQQQTRVRALLAHAAPSPQCCAEGARGRGKSSGPFSGGGGMRRGELQTSPGGARLDLNSLLGQTQGIPHCLPAHPSISEISARSGVFFGVWLFFFFFKFKTAVGRLPFLLAPSSAAKAAQTFQTRAGRSPGLNLSRKNYEQLKEQAGGGGKKGRKGKKPNLLLQ